MARIQNIFQLFRASAAALALFSIAACDIVSGIGGDNTGPSINPNGAVPVALLLPSSAGGGVSSIARDLESAARLAVADLQGRSTIDLRIYDTGGSPEGAAAAAQNAVNAGAKIVLGPLFFGSAVAAGNAIADSDVNILTFSNNTQAAGGNVFVLGRTFDSAASRLSQFAISQGMRDIAIVHGEDAAGISGRDAINRSVASSGGRVVSIESYPLSQQGIVDRARSIAQAAEATQPDAIFLTANASADLPLLLTSLPEAGLNSSKTPFLGITQWSSFQGITDIPGAQGGIFAGPDISREQSFRNRFRAAYDRDPHNLAALSYDGIAAIGALIATGRRDALSKANITRSSGFEGVSGPFRFLSNGISQHALAVYQIQGNRIVLIAPAPNSFGRRLF